MMRGLIICFCVAFVLVACTRNAPVQQQVTDSSSLSLKNRIPAADPTKYTSVRDARDWWNPYLLVQRDGIAARPISGETAAPRMKPTEVVPYLEKLPSIAWPYGLVVAVQENGLRARGDDEAIKRNREELLRALREAGIKVELWPSA